MTARRYGEGSVYPHEESGGAESWYGRWEGRPVNGKRRQFNRKLGPKARRGKADGLTETQAKAKLRQLMEADYGAPVARPDRITFGTAAERAITHLSTRKKRPIGRRTAQEYRSALATHAGALKDRPVADIDAADVEKVLADMAAAGKADKTILNAYTPMSQTFKYAAAKKWRTGNPCDEVETPEVSKAEEGELEFLKAEEVTALLGAVKSDTDFGPTDLALYRTAVMTGLRQGELMALRWRDVDWLIARLRVRLSYDRKVDKPPKSKAGLRSLPMAQTVAAVLEGHAQYWKTLTGAEPGDDDRVFADPKTGGPLDHSALSRRFKANLKRAKVRSIRFHALRHTYGTRLAADGVDLFKIMQWMGHEDYKTTLIYAHYAPAEDEAAIVEAAFQISSTHSSTQVALAAS